jgi:phosphatidylserine/phosphatidylglycerophosphate/cardiolipin synthase-like enzyme
MSQKRTALLLFAASIMALLVGVIIGTSAPSGFTQITATQQITTTSLATITVRAQGQAGFTEYCFSSGYGTTADCAGVLIKYLDQATTSIHVLIYSLTLSGVTDALVAAKNRGVDVKIVMDSTQANYQYSQYANLRAAGLNVRLSKGAYEMHDKITIIDGHIVITGSFNYTADSNYNNDENLLVLDSQALAAAYEQEFQVVWNASAP